MKTYAQINEAISAARLAQLKAKGKGDAAAAQMKADNLSSSKVSSTATSSARKALPSGETKGGALGGGALAKRSSQGTSITKRDTGKSGGLVRKTFTKPSPSKNKKTPKGYMTSPDGPGKPDKPRTLTDPEDSKDTGVEDSKDRESNVTNVNIDNTDKEKGGPCSGHRAKFNPFCKKRDDKLGTADGGTDGKDRSNSQI